MPPELLHLTLVFLGQTDPSRASVIADALAAESARRSAYRTTVSGAGGHVDDRQAARRGGVAWLTLGDGFEETAALALDVDVAIGSATYDERRRPRPHLTVARNVDEQVLVALRAEARRTALEWSTREIVLFRSHPGPGGSRYEQLASFELHG